VGPYRKEEWTSPGEGASRALEQPLSAQNRQRLVEKPENLCGSSLAGQFEEWVLQTGLCGLNTKWPSGVFSNNSEL
jgi:hypothetical protein